MKKFLFSLLAIVVIPVAVFAIYPQNNNIIPALDGSGRALGVVIDTYGSTANYFVSDQTITQNTTLTIRGNLGRDVSYIMISNDSTANALAVSFSLDGTAFGGTLNINALESFTPSRFVLFRSVRLGPTTSVPYRLWAW